MATEWFYKMMGDEFGPYTAAELKEQAALGNIQQDSFIRKGRDGDWVSAYRVKGLFENPSRQCVPNTISEPPPIAPPIPTVPPLIPAVPPPLPPYSPPEPISAATTLYSPSTTESQAYPFPQKSKKRHLKWLIPTIISPIIIALLIPIYSWQRNNGLRDKLRSCKTYDVIKADVYHEGFLSSDVVVFDLQDGGSSTARRIDPVHLFLQFSDKLDRHSVQRVILARNGRKIFYISSADLKPLSDSYANDGRLWAFNHLPERVCTMSGSHKYGEWTGGWLGVLEKQTEDLNEFIYDWTGY